LVDQGIEEEAMILHFFDATKQYPKDFLAEVTYRAGSPIPQTGVGVRIKMIGSTFEGVVKSLTYQFEPDKEPLIFVTLTLVLRKR
jgi:hypothetical protein